MQRKLAAILAADVVGYSRLMEVDEAGTLARLKHALDSAINPNIAAHNGRTIKLMGDGLLVEFPSVVDAVECAVDIQRAMKVANDELPPDRRLVFRVGVNLGDVIVDGDDIHGDGVNIAARLESLADPGGVLVSGTVFDHVGSKLDYPFEFRGHQQVKNHVQPVPLYRVDLDTMGISGPRSNRALRGRRVQLIGAIAAAIVLAAGAAAYWTGLPAFISQPTQVASKAKMALPLPDKPSIGVLPFANMSDETAEQHFADGMTDSLITDLSKVAGLFVIARNSTFVYQGKAVPTSQVAEELGVRYVLEGSVQHAGNRLRVNAQLINSLTGGHVWADRFDGNVEDVFAVQDAFVSRIVEALQVALTSDEKTTIARDKTVSVAAKEAFDEGWSHYVRFNESDNAAAVAPLLRALDLDPDYGRANAALALVYIRAFEYYWQVDPRISRAELPLQAERYLTSARKHPTSLYFVAESLGGSCCGLGEEARTEAGQAISLDPNDPEAHIAMALALIISGEPQEALNFVAAAKRLNPSYPAHYDMAQAIALFAAGQLPEAATTLNQSFERNADATGALGVLASVLALSGQREQARQTLETWVEAAKEVGSESLLAKYALPIRWEEPFRDIEERLYDGLRVAALPTDVTPSKLTSLLEDDDPAVQRSAAIRLGWFGPAAVEAVPGLVHLIEAGDPSLRIIVLRALGKIGPAAQAAVPTVTRLQTDDAVGSFATETLRNIKR